MSRQTRYKIVGRDEVLQDEQILSQGEMTFQELLDNLGDDNSSEGKLQTLSFLSRYGLIADDRLCEECPDDRMMSMNKSNSKDGFEWRCAMCRRLANADSSKRISVRRGSFFADSKLSLPLIIKLIYFWSINVEVNNNTIRDFTGINGSETINHYYNCFNDVCQNFIEKNQTLKEQLRGVIEIEHGKYFNEKYDRKRYGARSASPSIIMFERHSNKFRHFLCDYTNIHEFMHLITQHVAPGSTVITPGAPNYGGFIVLQKIFAEEFPELNISFVESDKIEDVQDDFFQLQCLSFKKELQMLSKKSADILPTWIYHFYFKRFFNFQNIFANFIVEIRKSFPFDLYHSLLFCLGKSGIELPKLLESPPEVIELD